MDASSHAAAAELSTDLIRLLDHAVALTHQLRSGGETCPARGELEWRCMEAWSAAKALLSTAADAAVAPSLRALL